MIFVTVGHQMPFDRLIRAVDEWAGRSGRRDVFAQIGKTALQPRNIEWSQFLSPDEFQRCIVESTAIVAHAGTGTIIAALQLARPLLVLPRLSSLGETRNDHQVPTAKHFAANGRILAAQDDQDLLDKLDIVEAFRPASTIGDHASAALLARIRQFVFAPSA